MSKFGNFTKSASILAHAGALITVTAWGVSFVSTKVLLENGLGPAEIYIYRFILAYILILIACHNRLWANLFRDELLFMTCGLCAGSIYFISENMALEYTYVTNVSLLVTTSPLITTMLMWMLHLPDLLFDPHHDVSGHVLLSLLQFPNGNGQGLSGGAERLVENVSVLFFFPAADGAAVFPVHDPFPHAAQPQSVGEPGDGCGGRMGHMENQRRRRPRSQNKA